MIVIKNKKAIDKMRIAGRLLATVMHEAKDFLVPGKTTLEINDFIEKRMKAVGLVCECKGYGGYQHATCISVNDVVVHGVPADDVILKYGDFVKIDVVGSYKKYCADMARYFFVGQALPVAKKLAETAQKALDDAVNMLVPGRRISDVSAHIQKTVESQGFAVVRRFVGHGIGKAMHEDPEVPNFGEAGGGPVLREGMTLAIEPMIAERGYELAIMSDGWTAKTRDGGLAAHVEDTVLVTSNGPDVLTRLSDQA